MDQERDRNEKADGEEDGSPGLLTFQIGNRVEDSGSAEGGKVDDRGRPGASRKNVDQPEQEEGVNAGLRVAVGSKHPGDIGWVDLCELGLELENVFGVGSRLDIVPHCTTAAPEKHEVDAQYDAGEGEGQECSVAG